MESTTQNDMLGHLSERSVAPSDSMIFIVPALLFIYSGGCHKSIAYAVARRAFFIFSVLLG